MASKKLIISVVAVVVIVAVLAIAIGSGGGQDSSESDARLNYDFTIADSFTTSSGNTQEAYGNDTYLILDITCANDHYSSGISTNSIIFQWSVTVGGLTYSMDVDTYLHPGYVLADIAEGSTGSWTLVFSIPEGTTADDVTISYEYVMIFFTPTFEIDESL